MNTDLSSDEIMIDSADALSEKIDNDVTVISPPQSLNGNDSVEEVAEPVRADDEDAMKKELFGDDSLNLEVETEAVHTWHITGWKAMDRRSHGPIFECGGSPWRVLFFPFGNNADCASFYLEQGYGDAPPKDWYRCVRFGLVLWNPKDPTVYHQHSAHHRFTADEGDWGFTRFSELRELFKPTASRPRPLVEDESAKLSAYVQVIKDPTGVLWHNFVNYDSKKETGYVGLKNQGATCYLNSLIQSYYFTNFFRKSVYKIPTEGEQPATNSALALQRLFYLLQTSNESVGTVELTKSFGWDTADIFSQQDVQELNRVLMDRLEEKMKGTEVENIMTKLFTGRSTTYVRCINVDYESERDEVFWDIQLNVRGFKTLDESFKNYILPEIMDGDNKYDAGVHKLQDAKKGVIFESFPDVLHLHLKRFEYDLETFNMQKVNDHFEFPEEFDASAYLSEKADKSEPYEYVLHGVLVHSGDLNAGHYYSFLRPEKDSPFFKFDDDRVTRATTREAIDENFGGEYPSTRKMAPMKRAMNAYMLVYYRKSRIDEILVPVAENDPPPHLQKMFDEERAIREQRRREREEAHHYVTIKVATEGKIKAHKGFDLINYESQGQDSSPLVVRFRKDNIVRDLRAEVAKELNVDPNHVRLWVMVNRQNKTVRPDVPLQDLDKKVQDSMPRESNKADFRLWAEVIPELDAVHLNQENSPWIVIFLKHYDPFTGSLTGAGHVYMRKSDRVADLVPAVAERMGWSQRPELKLYEEIKPSMIEPMKLKQSFQQAEIQDGDIICFQKALSDKEVEQVKELKHYADAKEYYEYLQNLTTIKFVPKSQPDRETFKLDLSKKMLYEDVAEKVGEYLGVPGTHLKFYTINQSTGLPRPPVKRNTNQNLHQILSNNPYYANSHIAYNDLLYDVLDIPLAEMETKKIIKIWWLPDGIREEIACEWLVPKNGALADTIPFFKDRFKLTEEQVEKVRFFQVHNGKFYKWLDPEYSVASLHDYAPVYAELEPEEHAKKEPGDYIIEGYQFHKEPSKSHGIPFTFLVKKGETFAESKKRLQTRIGIKGKLFEQIKFALVRDNVTPLKATYLQDDDILSELTPEPSEHALLGLDHADKNGRNGAYRHGEIRIK